MIALTQTREEFAGQRRVIQDEALAFLQPIVARVLVGEDDVDLSDAVAALFAEVYRTESGEEYRPDRRFDRLWSGLEAALRRASEESNVRATALMLATATINAATEAAAQDDPDELFMEWVTMHDAGVRPPHQAADGQVRPIGDKFDVGGTEMARPGDPTAPIELWINCRCVLRPTEPEFDSSQSVALASEKPWDGSASRFTPAQWKKSCILHVCPGEEKSCHKLPIREPGGALSRAGVHAAAGRVGQVDASPEQKASAKRALRGAYRELGEEPPPSLTAAGGSMDDTGLIPWHGVLAPEGVWSGDKRRFAQGSLSHRDLPLPLTFQKVSDDGHKGSVVVADISEVEIVDGLMKAAGYFLDSAEADEAVGLVAHFGKYGVSVDADDVEMEMDDDDDDEGTTFTAARVSSAAMVAIPAFAEAWIALGPWADVENPGPTEQRVLEQAATKAEEFVDVAPGRTEDGPGWLTHPVDTDRLRDYWVRGAGAAKIGWGTPGDFNRCRLNVAEYVKPQHLNGYCANRHYDALGFWPGRAPSEQASQPEEFKDAETAPALHLTAAAPAPVPAEFFANPNLTEPTPLTITDEGRVFGHVATWGTCHVGFDGVCMEAPRSMTGYAYFMTGAIRTDQGLQPVGQITVDGPHAPAKMRARPAMAHYDNTCLAVADVAVGDDDIGIWFSGMLRPNASEDAVRALQAGAISGDWRYQASVDNRELIAALAVNVPGFAIPRVKVGIENGEQVSLVAAGIVPPREERPQVDIDALAAAVVARLEEKQEQVRRAEELKARIERIG